MLSKQISCPSVQPVSWIASAGLTVLASVFLGFLAKLAIPLPFTPIPLAMHGCAVVIFAVLLGSKRGSAAVLGFLMQGAFGLPVLAGGNAGVAALFGPTGGYLFGYFAAAFFVGFVAERMKNRNPLSVFFLVTSGHAICFLFGIPYLATFVGLGKAFSLGLLPFLVGDALKVILSVKILQWIGWAKRTCL